MDKSNFKILIAGLVFFFLLIMTIIAVSSESDEEIYVVSEQTENNLSEKNSIPVDQSSTASGENCEVTLNKVNGVYEIPVTLNGTIKIDFIFDSGCSDVLISPDVASVLIKSGTLTKEDYLGSAQYTIADGSISEQAQFRLSTVQVGSKIVKNVRCSVSNSIEAPMLLGQSVMEKFGRFTFDYADQKLILE
jgi:aspartyl protease family protein